MSSQDAQLDQSMPLTPAGSGTSSVRGWGSAVMYPHTYVWYVFVSALDVMFTAVTLHLGGVEMNVVANFVLQRWDFAGMVLFKFVLVTVVICICEFIGRQNWRLGRDLGHWAVGITWIPVLLATLQLIDHAPH